MAIRRQVIVIHGGETFNNYKEYLVFLKKRKIDFENYRNPKTGWKKNLSKALGKNYEVIQPDMPNDFNSKYLEWKIWFEKFVPYFKGELILIGHSLGGVFLAKYLAQNEIPKKIRATFLVAAPYDDKNSEYRFAGFRLPENLEKFEYQGGKIFIYHSEDDPIVPFTDFKKYKKTLKSATLRVFKNRGHFINRENFPEIIRDIKSL
ncbi:MAG: alpha/beta fold hydrolase [Patescibacteria group bacterium]